MFSASPNPHKPPLSSCFTDPLLIDAFARAERGTGSAFALPARHPALLDGGAPVRPQDGADLPRDSIIEDHLTRLLFATRVAYALLITPMPIPALMRAAGSKSDDTLGPDLLDLLTEGEQLARTIAKVLEQTRDKLAEAVR